MPTSRLALAVVCLAAAAAAPAPAAPRGYIVRNVDIVDVRDGLIVPRQFVYVVGSRIEKIAPVLIEARAEGMELVDGSDMYLMPGLFDAHVHLSASPESFGPMLVANGVTCVRDAGAPTEVILGLRERSRGGDAVLPRVICTGAIIDGDPPVWPFSEACDEPEEARAAVRKLAEAGVDQIKVYSMLAPEVHRAAVAEAHEHGLKVTGHVPVSITLEQAIEAGQDCCEHLTGFEKSIGMIAGWEPDDPSTPWAWYGGWRRYHQASRDGLRALFELVKHSGMHQCPTLVVMKSIGRAVDPDEARADPRMAYVPSNLKAFWSGARYKAFAARAAEIAPYMRSLVGDLYRAGVPLMVGTDLANPYVFAGFAVHEEMALFEEAGVRELDILRAATIVPAEFCGVAGELGTIEEGKVASMVLVRGNPLDDIANAARIEGVFLRGRYFDRAALDGLLEGVETAVAATGPQELAALDLPGEELLRGRYLMKFQQFDAGIEDFLITRDGDRFRVKAHSRPAGGPQPPFVLTCEVDEDFTIRSADWVQTTTGLEATYTRSGDRLEATARRGGQWLPGQTMELPADALLSTPATAAEFATLSSSGLEPGHSRTYQAVSWGNPDWKLQVTDYTLHRLEDATVTLNGEQVHARHYRGTLTTSWGGIEIETWTNDWGAVLKSDMVVPMGTITVRLEGVAD